MKKLFTVFAVILFNGGFFAICPDTTNAQNLVSEIPDWFHNPSEIKESAVIGYGQAKLMDQAVVLALHNTAQNIESKVDAISKNYSEVDSAATSQKDQRNTSVSRILTSQTIAGIEIKGLVKSLEEGAFPEENLPEEYIIEAAISLTFRQGEGGYHAKLYTNEEKSGDKLSETQNWDYINSGGSFQTLLEHIQSHPDLTIKYASVWEETGFTYYVQLNYRIVE